MGKIKHLNQKKLDDVCWRLYQIHAGLNGLGSLFEFQSRDACFNSDELYGVGSLLKHLSRELSTLEDILRCGYDSRAVKKED